MSSFPDVDGDEERFWIEEEPSDDPIIVDTLRIRREVKSEDELEYRGTVAHVPMQYGEDILEALADHYDREIVRNQKPEGQP